MGHRFWTVPLLMLLVGPAACATPMETGPPAVIEAFYKAANDGNLEEVKRYYSRKPVVIEATLWGNGIDPIKNVILEAPSDDLKAAMNTYTRNGTLNGVEIQRVSVLGDTASCLVRKHFKGGATEDVTVELFRDRRDGQWKISWSSSTL